MHVQKRSGKLLKAPHTHTHTHIYIYIEREREWESENVYIYIYIYIARSKTHFNIQEAIYIPLDRPSLCRQRPSHNLHLLEIFIVLFFSPLVISTVLNPNFSFSFFYRFSGVGIWQGPDERALTSFLFCCSPKLHMIPLIICFYNLSCTNILFKYIYIHI